MGRGPPEKPQPAGGPAPSFPILDCETTLDLILHHFSTLIDEKQISGHPESLAPTFLGKGHHPEGYVSHSFLPAILPPAPTLL